MRNPLHLFASPLLVTAACGDSSNPADPPEFLFVQNSDAAILANSTLTLTGVSPQTFWFTDRPYREAGSIRTEEFLAFWDEGENPFAKDPPNAGFIRPVDGEAVDYAVELTRPMLSGGELSYNGRGVGDIEIPSLVSCDTAEHVFIDNALDEWCAQFKNRMQLQMECVDEPFVY